uniref:Putative ovule protein n=1 Tax=Solanum chacoense TaxID=4108 RepID=A0A0V0IEM2_SOLCH
MREFSDFIEDLKLLDIQLEDGQYTWFKRDNQDIASRIDRILISKEWDENFNNIKQIALQRLGSDHTPIALLGVWNQNKSYFKF